MKKEIEHIDIMCTTYVVISYMDIVFFILFLNNKTQIIPLSHMEYCYVLNYRGVVKRN